MLERRRKREVDKDTKTTVTIPYVKGVLVALSRVVCHHGVATAMKPHLTLKRMFVHPKDTTGESRGGVPDAL